MIASQIVLHIDDVLVWRVTSYADWGMKSKTSHPS